MVGRVCLLSRSWIADDPRVRRHGDALVAAGLDVVGVGYSGARADPPSWPQVTVQPPAQSRSTRAVRAGRLLTVRAASGRAVPTWWADPGNARWWDAVRDVRADLYLAYDWPMLPLAARLADAHGGRTAYDSREYGVQEHAYRWSWRLVYPPYVRGVERSLVPHAAVVTTVSDGIARLLQRDLGLATLPTVVRNVPPYQPVPAVDAGREPGDPLQLLYHGLLTPGRGLEPLVASAARWRPGRVLALRGFGPDTFVAELRRLAAPAGARVRFLPPVGMDELVTAAAAHDVGVMVPPGTTDHLRFSLPNKVFEYVMAGLALLVTDLPDMAALVERYQVGTLVPDSDPGAIAAAVDALDPVAVAGQRAAARSAAHALSWESESQVFVDAVTTAVG